MTSRNHSFLGQVVLTNSGNLIGHVVAEADNGYMIQWKHVAEPAFQNKYKTELFIENAKRNSKEVDRYLDSLPPKARQAIQSLQVAAGAVSSSTSNQDLDKKRRDREEVVTSPKKIRPSSFRGTVHDRSNIIPGKDGSTKNGGGSQAVSPPGITVETAIEVDSDDDGDASPSDKNSAAVVVGATVETAIDLLDSDTEDEESAIDAATKPSLSSPTDTKASQLKQSAIVSPTSVGSSKMMVISGKNEQLPMDLWENILGFVDVPELGSCAKVSKEMNAVVTKNDALWEPHLRKLLRTVFDGAFYIEEKGFWARPTPKPLLKRKLPTPLSKRTPLKSTSFRLWFKEWNKIEIEGKKYDPRWELGRQIAVWRPLSKDDGSWLVEDVPLRIYYREVASFAYKSLELELQSSDEFEHIDFDMFRGLPDIRLFHGLGGEKNSDDWDMDERLV